MSSLLHRAELDILAEYRQFYLQDGGMDPDPPGEWSDEDLERRVLLAPHLVAVCPERDMDVPVEVEVHAAEPAIDVGAYDHAVRCSIALETGSLQVHECTGAERLRLSVAPGTYCVLALFGGLGSLTHQGLIGEDRYRLVLWPSRHVPLQVLRAWPGPQPVAA